MSRRGIPFVISAPSGTGKTTVCRQLVEGDPRLEFSVSHTTRAPRPGEREGVHYHFVDEARFAELVREGAFVEHAIYAGHHYGTSFAALDGPLAAGRDLLLEVDVQGAEQLRAKRPDARFVMLLPPSREELERRLRGRGTDSPEVIGRRLASVDAEFGAVRHFDYAVVNEAIPATVAAVREIIDAERAGDVAGVRARHGRDAVLRRMAGPLRIPG